MDLGISGRKALIAGASSGLGYAAALALAAEGVHVTINSRSQERLDDAARRIEEATGFRPATAAGDLATEEGIQVIARAVRKDNPAGSFDILVSNTGGPPPGQFLDHGEEAWHQAGRLVLESAVRLTSLVLRGMVQRRWGRLIYITSVGVLQPIDDLILSNTYRAGVTGFCKTIANNYAKEGITANCVCPGYTATERLRNLAQKRAEVTDKRPEEIMDGFAQSVPAKRIGKPEELASLIAFLASEKAAFINGSSLAVDGGAHRALI